MATPRGGPAVVCVNGIVYAIGGGTDEDALSVERYDTTAANPSWESSVVPHTALPRGSAGATVDQWGRIWLIGGGGWSVPFDSVEIYDPARPEPGWTNLDYPLNHPRNAAGAVTDRKGRIYAIGGTTTGGARTRTVERFDPCNPNFGWVLLEDIPEPSSQTDEAVVGADGRIYVGGGWTGSSYMDRAVRYDPESDAWDKNSWAPLNQPRNNFSLVLGKNGRVYAIGGDSFQIPTATVECLTPPCGADQARPLLLDANGDGCIGVEDFLQMLAWWGPCW
jgi:kelch-like protein 28